MNLINSIQQIHEEKKRIKDALSGQKDGWLITYHEFYDVPCFSVQHYEFNRKNKKNKVVSFELETGELEIKNKENISEEEVAIAKQILLNTLNSEMVPCQF